MRKLDRLETFTSGPPAASTAGWAIGAALWAEAGKRAPRTGQAGTIATQRSLAVHMPSEEEIAYA